MFQFKDQHNTATVHHSYFHRYTSPHPHTHHSGTANVNIIREMWDDENRTIKADSTINIIFNS